MMPALFPKKFKDSSAVLDYVFRWGPDDRALEPPWLEAAETITTHTIAVTPAGLTVEQSEITPDGKDVLVWLSGGTVGATYTVACHVLTTLSRADTRRMTVAVQDR